MKPETTYPPYPTYKDSGIEWLSEIPEHWSILPIKRIALLRSGETINSESIEETGTFPVYGGNGLRGYTNNYTHEGHYALIGRQGALCGNINYATGKFWASEHAVVTKPKCQFSVRWLGELLRTMRLNQYSVSAAQPGLSVEAIAILQIPWPSLSEQNDIANFLDRETSKIDTLIQKQERLITLLTEKRQAVISHAVTKGLDPNVKMKDSGVEWLGQIPEHWMVMRIKSALKEPLMYGANEASDTEDPAFPRFVRITDIDSYGNLREDTFRSLPPDVAKPYMLSSGDMLLARSGATVGKSFLYRDTWGKCCFAGYLIRARVDTTKLIPNLLYYCCQAKFYWDFIGSSTVQATIQNVSAEKYANLYVPLSVIAEQQAIVEFLDRETAKIDALIAKAKQSIELLKERRSALISAAVTGKIDVRKAT